MEKRLRKEKVESKLSKTTLKRVPRNSTHKRGFKRGPSDILCRRPPRLYRCRQWVPLERCATWYVSEMCLLEWSNDTDTLHSTRYGSKTTPSWTLRSLTSWKGSNVSSSRRHDPKFRSRPVGTLGTETGVTTETTSRLLNPFVLLKGRRLGRRWRR